MIVKVNYSVRCPLKDCEMDTCQTNRRIRCSAPMYPHNRPRRCPLRNGEVIIVWERPKKVKLK